MGRLPGSRTFAAPLNRAVALAAGGGVDADVVAAMHSWDTGVLATARRGEVSASVVLAYVGGDYVVGVANWDYTSVGLACRHSCWRAEVGRVVGGPDSSSVSWERSGMEDENHAAGCVDEADEGGTSRLGSEARPKESDA